VENIATKWHFLSATGRYQVFTVRAFAVLGAFEQFEDSGTKFW
jgi:hypothetical protein